MPALFNLLEVPELPAPKGLTYALAWKNKKRMEIPRMDKPILMLSCGEK